MAEYQLNHTGAQIDEALEAAMNAAPLAHAPRHAAGGDDAIAPGDIGAAEASHSHAIGQVDGLSTQLSNRAEGKIRTFRALDEIGLQVASVTMDAILAAMPGSSLLIVDVTTAWPDGVVPNKYGVLTIENRYASRVACRFVGIGGVKMWVGSVETASGVARFTGWKLLAAAEPPAEYELPLASTLKRAYANTYSLDQFGKVLLKISFASATDAPIASATVVATLPKGFCPVKTYEFSASADRSGSKVSVSVVVSESGTVTLMSLAGSVTYVCGESTFVAAS